MADLVQPIVPEASNTANENFLRGFALLAQLSAKRRQTDLAIQKMINQTAFNEEKLNYQIGVEHDKTAHWEEMAGLTNRLRDIQEVNSNLAISRAQNALDAKQKEKDDAQSFGSAVAEISSKYDRGTKDWWRDINLLRPQFARYLQTVDGARAWNQETGEGKRAAQTLDSSRKTLMDIYDDSVGNSGLHPDKKIAKQIVADPTWWGKNTDGSRWIAYKPVQQKDSAGNVSTIMQPVKPEEVEKYDKKDPNRPPFTFKNIDEGKWNSWTKLRKTIDGMLPGADNEPMSPKDSGHSSEWQKAKAALGMKGDAAKIKATYSSKGYDPSELDSDTPP